MSNNHKFQKVVSKKAEDESDDSDTDYIYESDYSSETDELELLSEIEEPLYDTKDSTKLSNKHKKRKRVCKESVKRYNLRKRKKCSIKSDTKTKPSTDSSTGSSSNNSVKNMMKKMIVAPRMNSQSHFPQVPSNKSEMIFRIKTELESGLSLDEKYTYSPHVDMLAKNIENRQIELPDIIKCKIPYKEKIKLIELYNVYVLMRPDDLMTLTIKSNLYNQIKNPKNQYTEKEVKMAEELEKDDMRDQSILKKIINANLPKDRKKIIYDKYLAVANQSPGSEEQCKMLKWVNLAIKLPTKNCELFGEHSDWSDGKKIIQIKKKLDKCFYGQESVKERVLEVVNSLFSNNKTDKLIAFEGPPGVGKTMFAQILRDVLKIPMHQISFGGVTDSSFIHGHSVTYISSEPGNISKGLIKMGVTNGILFMDEVDKIGSKSGGDSNVSESLLHVLDFEQNHKFEDHYFSMDLDISNLIFILSLNDRKKINPILRNRLHFIKFKGYSTSDKIKIAKLHSIPKILKKCGLDKNEVIFTDKIIKYIINKRQKKEPGVRKMNNDLKVIIERINILKKIKQENEQIKLSYDILSFKLPCELTTKNIDKLYLKLSNEKELKLYV
jgi:ATP-dependent Lon protease